MSQVIVDFGGLVMVFCLQHGLFHHDKTIIVHLSGLGIIQTALS
jgi:hypothetical protein